MPIRGLCWSDMLHPCLSDSVEFPKPFAPGIALALSYLPGAESSRTPSRRMNAVGPWTPLSSGLNSTWLLQHSSSGKSFITQLLSSSISFPPFRFSLVSFVQISDSSLACLGSMVEGHDVGLQQSPDGFGRCSPSFPGSTSFANGEWVSFPRNTSLDGCRFSGSIDRLLIPMLKGKGSSFLF